MALCCIEGLGTLAAGSRPAVGTFASSSVPPATERMASQGRANKIRCVQGQGCFQSELAVLEARVLDLTSYSPAHPNGPSGSQDRLEAVHCDSLAVFYFEGLNFVFEVFKMLRILHSLPNRSYKNVDFSPKKCLSSIRMLVGKIQHLLVELRPLA